VDRADLTELHYITRIENVASMLARGVLCRNRAAGIAHERVDDPQVQARRNKKVPGGLALHDYANLYLNARNKMMYKVKSNTDYRRLAVLRVSTQVLDLPNVVIADQNAAASESYVRFRPAPDGLGPLVRDDIFARSWKYPDDYVRELRHGSAMCAEILVPDSVEPEFMTGIYVSCVEGRQALTPVLLAHPDPVSLTVNRDIFFM
jgi:hypothetical protein